MTNDLDLLRQACDEVVADPDLRPIYNPDGVFFESFCNIALRLVAQRMGCREFDDPSLNANGMIAVIRLNASGRWGLAQGQAAVAHALDGGLGLAYADSETLKEAHGHVAVVRPEAMQMSSSLKKLVPMVANVGAGDPLDPLVKLSNGCQTRRNWNCRVTQAFPVAAGEPTYALWV